MGRFLCIHLAAMAFLLVSWCGAQDGGRVLYVYTWEDYFAPEVVAAFEEANNCRVDFDYFDSYDTMYERVRNGKTGYDIITPASNLAEQMEKQGLLMNLNRRLIPNMRHLDTSRLIQLPDLEMRYHAPYTWSMNVIGYNREAVPSDDLGSWGIFARPGFKKRAAMMNDPRSVIGAALKYLGFSLNSTDPGEIEKAGEVLRSWKGNIALFDVNQPRAELAAGRLDFIQAFSGDMVKTALDHPQLAFFVPREGSIINADYFVIPVDAENQDLAHAFINHMFNPVMAARNMEAILYYMPNRAALAQLRPGFKDDSLLFFTREDIRRSEAVRDVGEATSLYETVWEDFLINDE